MEQVRYYYKSKKGNGWLSLKTPDLDGDKKYKKVSQKEWEEHLKELNKGC